MYKAMLRKRYRIELSKGELNVSIPMVFLGFLVLHFLAFGPLLQMHFAPDSYACMYKTIAATHFNHGRYVAGAIFYVLEILNINVIRNQALFALGAIGIYTSICTILFVQIRKYIKEETAGTFFSLFFGCAFFTVNVFNLELFFFAECAVVDPLGMLLACIAAVLVCNAKNMGSWAISFFLLNFSLSIYQANIAHFIIIATLLLVLQYAFDMNKKSMTHLFGIIAFGGVSGVVSILLQMWLSTVKTSASASFEISVILKNLYMVLRNQYGIWVKGCTLMPYMSIVVFVLVTWVIFVLGAKQRNQLGKFALVGFLASVLSFCITFMPHVVTSQPLVAQRTMTGVFFMVGLWTIFAVAANKKQLHIKVLAIVTACFMLLSVVQMNRVTGQHMAANQVDYEIGRTLWVEAQKQAKENNTTITQVAVCRDKKNTIAYPGIDYVFSDTNVKALNVVGSGGSVITYVAEEEGYGEITEVRMPKDIYQTYFADKNWNTVNAPEQVVVIGNTAYICMF